MDKYEYRIRAEEIEQLIEQGEYVQAAEIADTIDWRRVKSVMMLCKISDLYKINRRYEDARDMLLLAYERRPGGRTICYSLCELSIKMEEFVQAIEYYKEYVQATSSPKDSGRYILQYKLYEAQDVSLEERIAVLEKLKQIDYLPKWGYELAYLYHRVGLASRCVEECDELIVWFGDGKYVIKAMELKMLHQPLSSSQQEKYDHRFDEVVEPVPMVEDTEEVADTVVADMQDVPQVSEETIVYDGVQTDTNAQAYTEQEYVQTSGNEQMVTEEQQPQEMEIHVKTMDVGQYNTINLQAELAAGLREVLAGDRGAEIANPITRSIVAPMMESNTETLDYPMPEEEAEADSVPVEEEMESSEVFFGETGELGTILAEQTTIPDITAEIIMEQLRQENVGEVMPEQPWSTEVPPTVEQPIVELPAVESTTVESPAVERPIAESPAVEPPKAIAHVLSQESDGQISLVMPERESIEKQITGQISLTDILAEWERMKKENQEKREAEVRQHVLQQTGTMFTEFEAAVRDGLLEQLERDNSAETVEESVEESVETVPSVKESVEEATVVEEIPVIEELAEAPVEEIAAVEESVEEATVVEEIPVVEEVSEESDEVEELEEIDESVTEEILTEVAEETVDEATEEIAEEVIEEIADSTEVVAEEPTEESVEELQENTNDFAYETVTEEDAEEATSEQPVVERDKAKVRALTREEKELFAPFIQSKTAREQLVKAIDNISLAAYTGNVIITGEEGMDTLSLAKNMIREIQAADSNFSGKVAKITGKALNAKQVSVTLEQFRNGALIISKASEMNKDTVDTMHKFLQQDSVGIVVVLEGTKKAMDKFLTKHEQLKECFTARMDVEAMSNDALVSFGRQYAREREYSIDELGILALHTRVEDLQTLDHAVTVVEVKAIVDEAIDHANRKTLGHFFDILLAKRYDHEDMIILSEKDFA